MIPRNHFQNIEKLLSDEIVAQKDQILLRMSQEMEIPKDELVAQMYKMRAAKDAQLGIDEDNSGLNRKASVTKSTVKPSKSRPMQRDVSAKSLTTADETTSKSVMMRFNFGLQSSSRRVGELHSSVELK